MKWGAPQLAVIAALSLTPTHALGSSGGGEDGRFTTVSTESDGVKTTSAQRERLLVLGEQAVKGPNSVR